MVETVGLTVSLQLSSAFYDCSLNFCDCTVENVSSKSPKP
ncbi:hypothetical protein NIES2104_02580 [Leptolyngbya sp. NIES-2104]|nr:hypothetical protein NIES2104_02580 [Leptolyngbya sp. NIES-2104]